LKSVPRLLPNHPGVVLGALLGHGGGRNPQLVDLDPTLVLVADGMTQPEELTGTLDVIVIQVREAHHVEVVAARVAKVAAKLVGQVDTLVVGVLAVAFIGVVDQQLAAVGEVDPKAIGIPERKESDLGGHGPSFGAERRVRGRRFIWPPTEQSAFGVC
jgi:hypothetical protein